MHHRPFARAALAVLALPTLAHALTAQLNDDIVAADLAYPPSQAVFYVPNAFAPGTVWNAGQIGPQLQATSATDANNLGIVVGAVHLGNWIDGPGFDLPGGNDIWPDIAIDGVEDFSLHLPIPARGIAMAVSTGLSNLPSEVDHTGAVWRVSTDRGESTVVTLTDDGEGHAAWLRLDATQPFTRITFTELGANPADQYFGSIVALPVPEPASLPMAVCGTAAVALWRLRQRARA